MASRPKKPVDPPVSAVPEYVQQSRTYQRRKVTKRKLPSYTEAMLLLHMPPLQTKFYAALLGGLERGEKDCIRMAGEIMKVLEKGGISITNQLLQQNLATGEQGRVKGFDAFVRELAEARSGRALPAPAEAEVVELRPADTPVANPAEA